MTDVQWQAPPGWNALLISVGAYRYYPALRACDPDTGRLEAVLADPDICGFAKIDRLEDPTADQARQALTGFLERHGDSAMLIYFTGHAKFDFAAGRLHLLTADSPAHAEEYEGGSVTGDWLMRTLAMSRSDSVFLVLDACFGGAALSHAGALREIPYAIAFRALVESPAFHTLAAASPLEPDASAALTHALVDVLRDGSAVDETGRAPVGRVCEVVTKRVIDSGCGQTPLGSAHVRGRELYIARRPPAADWAPAPPRVPADQAAGAPADLAAVRQALANRDYAAVRRLLRPLKDSDNGECRYYAVLGMFGGHRPSEFATEDVRRAEGHLAGASAGSPQLCALWALIREDHYGVRGIDPGPPSVDDLMQRAIDIDPGHAAEIVTHLPAPECLTWSRLRNRAQSRGV